jgi:hypothetical protein
MDSDAEEKSGSLFLFRVLRGGVLIEADDARAIAQILLRRSYGEAEEARQLPLKAIDDGEYWAVRGAYVPDKRHDETGAFRAKIRKDNCKVVELTVEAVLRISPEAQKMLDRELGRPKTSQ